MKKEYSTTDRRLPDFIIAGAMKCGTTSLHKIIANHPKIFMPSREIHFYDVDDYSQHSDFFLYTKGEWYYPRFEEDLQAYLDWYGSFFEEAREDQLWGEDSTTYIASEKAAARIARLNPEAKIIIMLRDPASRAYSHYWHLVRTGRAIWNFENTLQIMPSNIIQKSLYKKQIENFMKFLPKDNFHFILFEEFIQDVRKTVEGVFKFLSVPSEDFDLNQMKTHYNVTKTRMSHSLQLLRNRILRLRARRKYLDHLVDVPDSKNISNDLFAKMVDLSHHIINPRQNKKPPRMKSATRRFLNEYLSHENEGLSDLIGIGVDSMWYRE